MEKNNINILEMYKTQCSTNTWMMDEAKSKKYFKRMLKVREAEFKVTLETYDNAGVVVTHYYFQSCGNSIHLGRVEKKGEVTSYRYVYNEREWVEVDYIIGAGLERFLKWGEDYVISKQSSILRFFI